MTRSTPDASPTDAPALAPPTGLLVLELYDGAGWAMLLAAAVLGEAAATPRLHALLAGRRASAALVDGIEPIGHRQSFARVDALPAASGALARLADPMPEKAALAALVRALAAFGRQIAEAAHYRLLHPVVRPMPFMVLHRGPRGPQHPRPRARAARSETEMPRTPTTRPKGNGPGKGPGKGGPASGIPAGGPGWGGTASGSARKPPAPWGPDNPPPVFPAGTPRLTPGERAARDDERAEVLSSQLFRLATTAELEATRVRACEALLNRIEGMPVARNQALGADGKPTDPVRPVLSITIEAPAPELPQPGKHSGARRNA